MIVDIDHQISSVINPIQSQSYASRFFSFHASLSRGFRYYDNACSYSMVKDLSSLTHVELLRDPFYIGGIAGSSLYATHSGQTKGFPFNLAKAYWGPQFDVDLTSLGYIQRCGGSYVGKGNSLKVFNSDGTLIDEAIMQDNNLFPVTFMSSDDIPLHAFSSRRYTAEEITHMNVAEELHIFYGHPSDDTLIAGINFGHIPTHITASAVHNNRLLRGPCPHCLAGKITNDPMPSSLHEPESDVAQYLSTDVHQLMVPSPGGNTHKSNVIDHKTGHFGVVLHKSKHTTDMVDPLKKYIAVQFNAHGHRAANILTDAESIYKATKPKFATFGIDMNMTPPAQHAQRVERYTRTADERKRATLSGLSFVIPSKYELYVDLYVAKMMNDLPNSLTSPQTPTTLVEGARPVFHKHFPFLPFGATCMVQQYKDKITKIAKSLDTSVGTVPKAELGVCMGEDPSHKGSYLFLVANGEVVPRRVLQPVNVHPWNWLRKFSPTAELLVPRAPKLNYDVQLSAPMYVDPHTSASKLHESTFEGGPVSDSFPVPSMVNTLPDSEIFSFLQPPVTHLHDPPSVSSTTTSTVSPALAVTVEQDTHTVDPQAILPPLAAPTVLAPFLPIFSTTEQSSLSNVQIGNTSSVPFTVASTREFTPVPLRRSLRFSAASPLVSSVSSVRLPPYSPPARNISPSPVNVLDAGVVSPELRRSTRPKIPSVPGAHRSYVGSTTSSIIDSSNWTPVGGSAKSNALIRRNQLSYHDSTITSNGLPTITIATETVHDMTVQDAISYLSNINITSHSKAYVAANQLRPQPPSKGVEHSFKKAMTPGFVVAQTVVEKAVCNHLDMLINELSTFSLVSEADIQSDCVRVYAQLLVKIKADERVTARMAAGGNRQPSSSHGETFAPTASESSSNLILAAYQALGRQQQLPVETNSFDMSNAFQNTILDKINFPRQILMLMPDNLPGKYESYSGKWVEVHKAINGLRQANELFDREVRTQMDLAGFSASCDPCVYHKQDSANPHLKCSINMHVDDGLSANTCPQFYQDAIKQLTLRWGTLTHQFSNKKLYNGKNITTHSNGVISLSVESYITRVTKELGVAHLPSVSSPSTADLFHPSINTTLADKKLYARFNGCLTHVTSKGRYDVRKESQHLSKSMIAPTEDDMSKMIHVWQYLNCTASMGPVYDNEDGTQLVLHVDTAFGVHSNGASHTGAYLSIGRYNAPIWVMSKQQEDIALSPQASEYFGLSDPLQSLLWHRQLMLDLGFPQERTIVWEDNIPAINLAYSPQITRKSRYMFVRHHFVRSLVQSKVIKICHVESPDQAADLLTHSPKPSKFKHHRYALFNLKSLPTG